MTRISKAAAGVAASLALLGGIGGAAPESVNLNGAPLSGFY